MKEDRSGDRVKQARRRAESRMDDVRRALRRETGRSPSKKGWWLLIAAAAVGLTFGLRRMSKD